MKRKLGLIIGAVLTLNLTGCGGGDNGTNNKQVTTQNNSVKPVQFMANQLGFSTAQAKHIVIQDIAAKQFTLVDKATNVIVLQGPVSSPKLWQPAGKDLYQGIDISEVKDAGQYQLKIDDAEPSIDVLIDDSVYLPLHNAALKAFYYNRASTPITSGYTGPFVREMGHPDTQVNIHQSAASSTRPTGSVIASTKGWYDAGDFGKYVVNSGIATYTLLLSFDQHKDFYLQQTTKIPESNNDLPDILDEIKWNLDWLATMQDEDGGVYHKLTTLEWPGIEMPDEDQRERYVIGKTTSAALNFAATMAYASRIYPEYYQPSQEYGNWLNAAKQA